MTGLDFVRWDDKDVFVSYQVPREAGEESGFKYTSYLFGNGAIGYSEPTGDCGPKKPVEIDSLASAGNGEGVDTVWYRRHWVMHPRGVSHSGKPASASGVTDTAPSTATNWNRVYDPKLIRMVAVVTNGWATLSWQERRSLASQLSDDPITNGEQADAAIEAELKRRG